MAFSAMMSKKKEKGDKKKKHHSDKGEGDKKKHSDKGDGDRKKKHSKKEWFVSFKQQYEKYLDKVTISGCLSNSSGSILSASINS